MSGNRQLAIVSAHAGLTAALRTRADAVEVSRETIDACTAGVPAC
jgi:hypothetical protein